MIFHNSSCRSPPPPLPKEITCCTICIQNQERGLREGSLIKIKNVFQVLMVRSTRESTQEKQRDYLASKGNKLLSPAAKSAETTSTQARAHWETTQKGRSAVRYERGCPPTITSRLKKNAHLVNQSYLKQHMSMMMQIDITSYKRKKRGVWHIDSEYSQSLWKQQYNIEKGHHH